MLLVADDANAAYSNPRVLPKRRLPCRLSLQPTALAPLRAPSRQALAPNNTDGPCAAGVDANLNDMGYRGEDVSRTPANWAHQAPGQSSPGDGQGGAGSWVDGSQGYGNDDYDDYASDGAGHGYQGGDGYGGYPRPEQGQYGQRDAYSPPAPYAGPGGYGQPADYGYQGPTTATRERTTRTASRATSASPSRAMAGPVAPARGIRRRATATVSPTATRRGTPAGPTPRCPMAPTAIRDGTPGTTGTAASQRPHPAPASPTPARTR